MRRPGTISRLRGRLWRPVVGIVAAYALVVQSLLIGILGATLAARAAGADALPGYELCLSHDAGTANSPDNPAEHSNCTAHCLLCIAGGQKVVLAPANVPLGRIGVAVISIRWEAYDWRNPPAFCNPVARQRGPPLAA
jgi:hypothetical protein